MVNDQNVSDIITSLVKTHAQYAREYDKISSAFVGANEKIIGSKIWHFLKKNINYKIEPDEKQLLKSPSAILYTGKTIGSDCKNYSLFTAGILDSLNRKGYNINWCFRFASYRIDEKTPHHVFVVINPDTNNEIWIDAVLKAYDLKKQYFYKTDRKSKNMALIAMSGIEYEGLGKAKKAAPKKAARKAAQPAKKAARKEKVKKAAQKIKGKIKQAGKMVLKFSPATVAVRNAFLLLVKLNVRSLATNLAIALKKDANQVLKFWTGAGGNADSLKKAVAVGAKKKRLGEVEYSIGALPAAAAGAVTAATPLLLKVVAIFKKMGIKTEDLAAVASNAVKKIAQNKLDQINEAAETGDEDTSAGTFESADIEGGESGEVNDEGGEGDEGGLIGFIKKNPLVIGAAVLGIGYSLTK